jgi:endonuclease YncB( thermonuclease family)
MLLVTPIVSLLLAWGNDPVVPNALKDHQHVGQTPIYKVLVIKSGVEILVKGDGNPTTVRLLGIDTPRVSPEPQVNVLNQMNHLRGLIPIGAKVSLETGAGARPDAKGLLLAQVRRASNGRSVNLDMLDQGYATTSTTQVFSARADFAAAEQRAKQGKLGMWAPNFLQVAFQPTPIVPPRRGRRPGRVAWGQAPQRGGVGQPKNEPAGDHTTSSSEMSNPSPSEKSNNDPTGNQTAGSSRIRSANSSGSSSSVTAHSQGKGNARDHNARSHQWQNSNPRFSSFSFSNDSYFHVEPVEEPPHATPFPAFARRIRALSEPDRRRRRQAAPETRKIDRHHPEREGTQARWVELHSQGYRGTGPAVASPKARCQGKRRMDVADT